MYEESVPMRLVLRKVTRDPKNIINTSISKKNYTISRTERKTIIMPHLLTSSLDWQCVLKI